MVRRKSTVRREGAGGRGDRPARSRPCAGEGLGRLRSGGGRLVDAPAGRRPDKDVPNAVAAPEGARRWEATLGRFRDERLRLLEDERGIVPAADLDRDRAALVDLLPDDERVRAANGERRVDGRWILEESERTPKQRERIAGVIANAIGAVPPPAAVEPSADERRWSGKAAPLAFQAEHVRIAGTAPGATLVRAGTLVDAFTRAASGAFSMKAYRRVNDAFVFKDYGGYTAALNALSDVPAREKAADLRLGNFYTSGGTLWVNNSLATGQIRTVVRRAAELAVSRSAGQRPDAVYDGVVRYLTWRMTGTNGGYYVEWGGYGRPETPAESAFHKRMFTEPDWVRLARERLPAFEAERGALRLALGKEFNALTPEDCVLLFALAAYLFEGASDRIPAFMECGWYAGNPSQKDQARRKPLDQSIERSLGRGIEALEARLPLAARDLANRARGRPGKEPSGHPD